MTSPNSVSSPNTPSTRCSEVSGRRSQSWTAVATRPTASRAATGALTAPSTAVPRDGRAAFAVSSTPSAAGALLVAAGALAALLAVLLAVLLAAGALAV